MIPVPPPADAALSNIGVLFDGDAMREALDASLGRDGSGYEVTHCRPFYVRYKPRTNCLVQYELRLESRRDGTVAELPAHAWIYADGKAERIWRRPAFQALLDRARRSHPTLAIPRAVHLEGLRALVEVYPVDGKLPALVGAASVSDARAPLLESLGGAGGESIDLVGIELVRYKPGRKALLRYRLGGGGHGVVYGKLHADGLGQSRFRTGQLLSGAGLPTPAVLGHAPVFDLVIHAAAEGTRLRDLRGNPAFERSIPAVAAALLELHSLPIDAIPGLRPADEVDYVLTSARAVGSLLPERAVSSFRLATRIADRIRELETRPVILHGDFYDDQVLVSERGAVLLDFDGVGIGPAAADVGNFLAHLAQEPDESNAFEGARNAFLDSYLSGRSEVGRSVALFEAASLLARAVAPFRQLHPDWPDRVARIVELAEQRFERFERSTAVRAALPGVRAVDPALPGLARLQDRAAVADELERGVYGRPTKVADFEIVRHKPGRRCTLLYRVLVNGDGKPASETLYAKTYVRGRAQRVHDVLDRVRAARAWGPDVVVPDPVAYLPDLDAAFQREVPGRPVADPLVAGDAALAGQIADALNAFHRARLELPARHSLQSELAPLAGRVEELAARCPALEKAAREALGMLEETPDVAWRWRPVHRDFYYDQVFAGTHGLSLLDFDDAAMSEPAVDVGNFLAHLRLLSWKALGRGDGLSVIAEAFLTRMRELDPELDPELVRYLEGATLLRLAPIHAVKENGPWIAARLLEESRRVLAGGRRSAVAS